MTSEERREARYQRRIAKRMAKRNQSRAFCDDFNIVFSYENLYRSYKKCRRNVAWKASVQKYITQAPLMVNQTYEKLQAGKFKSSGFYEFDINERGKIRHIKSVTIAERVVQRCLCDNALVPMLSPTFIYDNGASLENRVRQLEEGFMGEIEVEEALKKLSDGNSELAKKMAALSTYVR